MRRRAATLVILAGILLPALAACSSSPAHLAIAGGDVGKLQSLLNSGFYVDTEDEAYFRQPPLHDAVHAGRGDIVKLLLDHGANVNAQDMYKRAPLHYTSEIPFARPHAPPPHNARAIAELLVAHGARLDTQDNHKWTPLHRAVKSGQIDLARFLLAAGASTTLTDEDGRTPQQLALAPDIAAVFTEASPLPPGRVARPQPVPADTDRKRPSTVRASPPASIGGDDREVLFWKTISDSKTPGDYEAYLQQFPGGTFSNLASSRLDALRRTTAKPSSIASRPVVPRFPRGGERPDDVAVIIGNADYGRLGKDIPDVRPAHADAEGARLYATQALGIKDGNIIVLKDATGSQMTRVFGSKDNYQGQLFDWVKPGKSHVYVYYSGHGAPGSQGGSPYLVPTDSDAARIELNGYPLKQLYDNLGKLPAESVTVVLEACFSGVSPAGSVLGKASPVFFDVKAPPVPANLTVIAAGAANQMASWETDESSGLFTKYYLKGMAGEADADKDGRISLSELDRYLKETLTYYARRHYGRDQQAQIVKGGGS